MKFRQGGLGKLRKPSINRRTHHTQNLLTPHLYQISRLKILCTVKELKAFNPRTSFEKVKTEHFIQRVVYSWKVFQQFLHKTQSRSFQINERKFR